ncbi:hypothetical protein FKM82_026334 [Ascaphus truei]
MLGSFYIPIESYIGGGADRRERSRGFTPRLSLAEAQTSCEPDRYTAPHLVTYRFPFTYTLYAIGWGNTHYT